MRAPNSSCWEECYFHLHITCLQRIVNRCGAYCYRKIVVLAVFNGLRVNLLDSAEKLYVKPVFYLGTEILCIDKGQGLKTLRWFVARGEGTTEYPTKG